MTDTSTGNADVIPESIASQVSEMLSSLEQVEVAEHPSIYESIDQLLRDRLATRLDATQ